MLFLEEKRSTVFLTGTLLLPAGDFYGLLTTFANSLDPDQGPDLDPNCLTL